MDTFPIEVSKISLQNFTGVNFIFDIAGLLYQGSIPIKCNFPLKINLAISFKYYMIVCCYEGISALVVLITEQLQLLVILVLQIVIAIPFLHG